MFFAYGKFSLLNEVLGVGSIERKALYIGCQYTLFVDPRWVSIWLTYKRSTELKIFQVCINSNLNLLLPVLLKDSFFRLNSIQINLQKRKTLYKYLISILFASSVVVIVLTCTLTLDYLNFWFHKKGKKYGNCRRYREKTLTRTISWRRDFFFEKQSPENWKRMLRAQHGKYKTYDWKEFVKANRRYFAAKNR